MIQNIYSSPFTKFINTMAYSTLTVAATAKLAPATVTKISQFMIEKAVIYGMPRLASSITYTSNFIGTHSVALMVGSVITLAALRALKWAFRPSDAPSTGSAGAAASASATPTSSASATPTSTGGAVRTSSSSGRKARRRDTTLLTTIPTRDNTPLSHKDQRLARRAAQASSSSQ